MLVFTTHKYLLFTRKEIWFYNGEPLTKGTYSTFSAAKKLYGNNNQRYEKYITSIIDLTKSDEDLFNAIHPTYRYDIRSAEKKNLEHIILQHPNKNDCENLIKSYNLFAREKELAPMNTKYIFALQKTGNLCITKAELNGVEISTHLYIFDKNTISLSNSFNNVNFTDSKIRSEANKWLHWKDLLQFKKTDFKIYDFGGLNPKKLPGVSKFKMSFGGETVENYRFIITSPFIFNLLNFLKKIKK